MEENSVIKCIKNSQEYGFLILDCFQYEPIYSFPKTFNSTYKPPRKVLQSEIIDYRGIKCGLELITNAFILVLIVPSIPDHILKQALLDISNDIAPLLSELAIQEELSTARTDSIPKPKKILKPEQYEVLSNTLEEILPLTIYKLYPYFLYEDEEALHSCINYPSLCLPIGIGGIGLYLSLPIDVLLQIDMACQVLFHDSTVSIHEIISLEPPSGIIKELILLYKGYIISGSLPAPELSSVLRIYNTKKLYKRNDTHPMESFYRKVRSNGKDFIISFICVRGLTIAIFLLAVNDGLNDYDPWMIDKGKRLANELQDRNIIDYIHQAYKKIEFNVEFDIIDNARKQELIDIMKKSRSLDSSPLGSPRNKDKVCQPVYYPQHDLYLFHYALVDTRSCLICTPQIISNSLWNLLVLRPLFSHYALLYERLKSTSKDFIQINANFSNLLVKEKIIVAKYDNFVLYAMYRGNQGKIKQFIAELVSNFFNYS
jgi:hypothetical protein